MRGTEETATVLRHTVQYAVARRQAAEAALPMLLWVAGDRGAPLTLALASCRRDLSATPTSTALAREVDMLAFAVDALASPEPDVVTVPTAARRR